MTQQATPDIFSMIEEDAQAKLTKAPSDADSSRITALGLELALIESRMEKGAELMKLLSERRQAIMEKDLVDAMDAIGQDRMGLAQQDVDVEVKTKVHAALPAKPKENDENYEAKMAKRSSGLNWLRADGHEAVINTKVVLTFPRGMDGKARQLAAEMSDRAAELREMQGADGTFEVDVAEDIPWATLTKLVKELTEQGRSDIPLDLLGARVFRLASIVKRKKDRRK